MTGIYSIAEAVDDSNKRPNKTLFLYLQNDDGKSFETHQTKSLEQTKELIVKNGAKSFESLKNLADYLNKTLT